MTSGLLDTAFKSLDKVKKELTKVAHKSIEKHSPEIAKLNTDQLLQGKDADGNKITPEYASKYYAKKKNQMNSLPGLGTPDLKLTGDFHEGFFAKPIGEGWQNYSRDSKTPYLLKNYNKDIFGNTKEDEKEINEEYVLPDLLEHIIENVEI